MKIKNIFTGIIVGVTLVSCDDSSKKESVKIDLEDERAKLSYSLAVMTGNDLKAFKEQFEFFDDTIFQQGLRDVFEDKTQIDMMAAQQNLNEYSSKMRDEQINVNISQGDAYLKENGAKEGVITLENGMQYEILTEGTGVKPTDTDRVSVHYHGTLIDGTVFDSSVDKGSPVEFGITEVIQGWIQVLQLMPVGSKWKVSIPFNLAYGAKGGGPIPPYAALIFEMELIDIVK